ncbi:MAG: hypothetical protein E7365_00775 [Clostridiales bacterium]|nr:hypothetical protein [Clostridiales bacterium]
MKLTCKQMFLLFYIFILFVLCGCSNNFEPIAPPVNEFPTYSEYKTTEVFIGDLKIEKSFRGNYKNDGLYTTSGTLKEQGFFIGEKGYVSYEYNNEIITLEATLVENQSDIAGSIYAQHKNLDNDLKFNWPGKFFVITFEQSNCMLVSQNAVSLLDDEGNALVYSVNDDNLLVEKQIKVGYSNEKYYQVISGLNVGEKVVLF